MFYAGIAKNERDLFSRLQSALTGAPLVGRISYVGTGDGNVDNFHMPIEFYNTLIELECTVEDDNEAEFSVTIGGVTELSAVTNIPYTFEGVTFMITMGAIPFDIGDKFTIAAQGEATFVNAAPDLPEFYFATKAAGVEEDITIECDLASVAGAAATFTVDGSVSGSLGVMTQADNFSHAIFSCSTFDGFDFTIGDKWVIPLRATPVPVNYQWEILEEELATFTDIIGEAPHQQTRRLALRGKGNAGTENIYTGILRIGDFGVENAWSFTGYTGWDTGVVDHTVNLGYIAEENQPIIVTAQTDLTYYVSINGRRIMGCIVAGSICEHFYLGHLMQHQSPTYDPYPLFIGGSSARPLLDTSYSGDGHYDNIALLHTAYFEPRADRNNTRRSSAVVYTGNDEYVVAARGEVQTYTNTSYYAATYDLNKTTVYPFGFRSMERMNMNFDNTYSPVPVYVARTTQTNNSVKGRFDGLYAVSADGGQQQGNVFVFDGRYHVVFHNVFRTGAGDFCAIEVK